MYNTRQDKGEIYNQDFSTRAYIQPGDVDGNHLPCLNIYQVGGMLESQVRIRMNPDDLRLLADQLEKANQAHEIGLEIKELIAARLNGVE